LVSRVLDSEPITSLKHYLDGGGTSGLAAARDMEAASVIERITEAGVRGRGGAGFPTGVKWQTVAANASDLEASAIVVNASEGEPGSFKDREILRRNPYRVIEGALIAARAVGASKIVVGMKRTHERDIVRVRAAIDEMNDAGLLDSIACTVVEGPPEYLLGEETALLEVIDGRLPFPRLAQPFRRGVDEVVEHATDLGTASSSSAHVELAGPTDETVAPPTAVDNVETFAHVALVLEHGVDWFREIGTERSPGSIVCTVSGATVRAGVGEVAMGTTLREAIELIGGGLHPGRQIAAVLQGVSASVLTPDVLDVPLTWEDVAAVGSGLGASAFIVFDDTSDPVAIAAAVSRFLAVESCGQCTPCKQDGLAISDALERLCRADPKPSDDELVRDRLITVADSARCSLANQHQDVVGSILRAWPEAFAARHGTECTDLAAQQVLPLHDLVDGRTVVDIEQLDKQPDWTFGERWSGQSPADRLDEHRSHQSL
jgi:NADH:ubiquinone oxidoreductase subunit F (NADH-binding)